MLSFKQFSNKSFIGILVQPHMMNMNEEDEHLTFGNNLGSHADIGTNKKDADFWIVRKGSKDKVGSVTDEYHPEHIGVKIRNHTMDPQYMNYAMQHVHKQGYYEGRSNGTTGLQNIKVSDVKSVPVQSSPFSSIFRKK